MPDREGRRARTVRSAASIAAILAAFLLVRLPLLTREGVIRGWNSDSAIFGLMAKKIHDGTGFDVFFWGQNHLGPLTSILAAAIRKAFLDPAGVGPEGGALALRLASMIEIAFAIGVSFLALQRLFGYAIALVAGLWLAAGPSFLVRVSAVPMGPEMSLALGSVLLLLAAHAITNAPGGPDRPVRQFSFGLVAGLGWWMNQTVVFVIAPAALVLALRSTARGTGLGRIARLAAPLAAGFVLGHAPVWLGRLLGWYEPTYTFRVPLLPQPGVVSRAARFVTTDFWRLVGLDGRGCPPGLWLAGLALAALLLLVERKRFFSPVTPAPPTITGVELAGAIVGTGAYVFVLTERTPGQLRYLAPALPAALGLLGAAVAEGGRWARRRLPRAVVSPSLGLLAVLALILVWTDTRRTINTILREPDPRPLLQTIEAGGYTVCHADYWTAYKLQFLSDERVRFVPFHSFDRNREESARLRRTAGPQCLVTPDGAVRPWGPEDAADEGGPARRRAEAATPSKPASPDRGPSSLSP